MQAGEGAPHEAQEQARGDKPAPELADALHALGAEGRAGLKAAGDTARSLQTLIAADVALAHGAFARSLALAGVAIAFGGSAWMLLMAALVAALQAAGLSWLVALLIAAMLSLAVTAAAGITAMRYFEHTRMQATRRQLARLGFTTPADAAATSDRNNDDTKAGHEPAATNHGTDTNAT